LPPIERADLKNDGDIVVTADEI